MATRDLVYNQFKWTIRRVAAPGRRLPFQDDTVHIGIDLFECEHTFSNPPGASPPECTVERTRTGALDLPLNELTLIHFLKANTYTLLCLKWVCHRFKIPADKWKGFHLDLLLEAKMASLSPDRTGFQITFVLDRFLRVRRNQITLDAALEASFQEAAMSVVHVPATEEAISRGVERFLVARNRATETCSICLDNIAPGAGAGRMTCKHIFHDDCILQWLGVSGSCPLCRTRLLE